MGILINVDGQHLRRRKDSLQALSGWMGWWLPNVQSSFFPIDGHWASGMLAIAMLTSALEEIWVWLKINQEGVTQVLVHVSTCQGSILVPFFRATAI